MMVVPAGDGAEEFGVLHLGGLIPGGLAGLVIGGRLGVAAFVVALGGGAVIGLLVVVSAAAAGRQAQQHGQGQQEG